MTIQQYIKELAHYHHSNAMILLDMVKTTIVSNEKAEEFRWLIDQIDKFSQLLMKETSAPLQTVQVESEKIIQSSQTTSKAVEYNCPTCGGPFNAGESNCPYCGADVSNIGTNTN